jgi:Protein of unknown function (DUF3306)
MTPGPDKIKAGEPEGKEGEPFLSRWARRKEEARLQPQEPVRGKAANVDSPAPLLPPIDELTPESDFRPFFHPKVDESVRRAALKKLFNDPHFNIMDGLDTYIDDYSKTEPIPAAMMAGLRQAQNILQWAKEDEEKREKDQLIEESPPQSPQSLDAPAAPPASQTAMAANAPGAVPAPAGGTDGPAKP